MRLESSSLATTGTGEAIYHLGVDADSRRWGLDRKLIWRREGRLGRFAAPKIRLMVRSGNEAQPAFTNKKGNFRFFYRRISTKYRRAVPELSNL